MLKILTLATRISLSLSLSLENFELCNGMDTMVRFFGCDVIGGGAEISDYLLCADLQERHETCLKIHVQ